MSGDRPFAGYDTAVLEKTIETTELREDAESLPKKDYEQYEQMKAELELRKAIDSGTKVKPNGTNKQSGMGGAGFDQPTNFADAFTKPTVADLQTIEWEEESNLIATDEQIRQVVGKFKQLGVPEDKMARAIWSLVRYCASVGSSAQLNPDGTDHTVAGKVSRDSMVAAIKKVCTLRQFCRAYAPIIWNMMLTSNKPPEGWADKGFGFEERFAAFDFFSAVENSAAMQPKDGLIRRPTKKEYIANQTHYSIALNRSAVNDSSAIMTTEITGGKFGGVKGVPIKETKCS